MLKGEKDGGILCEEGAGKAKSVESEGGVKEGGICRRQERKKMG